MKTTYLDIEDRYELQTDNEEITADVIIGNAQAGSYTFFLDKESKGQDQETLIGKSGEIRGSKLIVSALVQDVRTETNWLSITLGITEKGSTNKYGPYSKKVDTDLDRVLYTIIIDMV
ncbi:MAG: hypothetical protein RIC80_04900 [Cyclobacteriaceae bacterium]